MLLDLNLLLNHIMPLKIYREKEQLHKEHLCKLLDSMRESKNHRFIPSWSNVQYWYAPEILKLLSHHWGYIYSIEQDVYAAIIKTALLKVSKRFSYTEHRLSLIHI